MLFILCCRMLKLDSSINNALRWFRFCFHHNFSPNLVCNNLTLTVCAYAKSIKLLLFFYFHLNLAFFERCHHSIHRLFVHFTIWTWTWTWNVKRKKKTKQNRNITKLLYNNNDKGYLYVHERWAYIVHCYMDWQNGWLLQILKTELDRCDQCTQTQILCIVQSFKLRWNRFSFDFIVQ